MRLLCLLAALALCASPCAAYLYDCGPANYAGAILKDGTTTAWAAEPFSVSRNAYATQFGAALGRAYGPAGAGFTVELATWVGGQPDSVIESWTVTPANAALTYYYFEPTAPVFLSSLGSGSYYALVFKPNDPGFAGAISYTSKGGIYYGYGYNTTSGWFQMQYPLCIRVDGYYVPEPGCICVLLCGLVSLGLRRSKRLLRH